MRASLATMPRRATGTIAPHQWADGRTVTFRLKVRTDGMPYPDACDLIEPAYGKLVGASLLHGFRKTLYDMMGGVRGCSHVTELLAQAPTAAIQMFAGLRREIEEGEDKPFQLDRCHALETTTDTVQKYYPQWYRGAS